MVNQIFIEDRKETARKIKKSRAKTREKVMEQLKQSLTGESETFHNGSIQAGAVPVYLKTVPPLKLLVYI